MLNYRDLVLFFVRMYGYLKSDVGYETLNPLLKWIIYDWFGS